MKLKKIIPALLISMSLLGLSACSSLKSGHDEAAVSDADMNGGAGGAQASGAGDEDQFGGSSNLTPEQLLAKRTYYFDFDNSSLHDEDRAAVSANADNIVAHAGTKVLLEGHTDPRGSREYNVALGERRANAVAELLKSRGVNPSQIRVVSYGAEKLAAPGHNDSDYQLDRRVVLVYLNE